MAPTAGPAPPRVVVVSEPSRMRGLLEMVLDAGSYDVVCVESAAHAYSQIKRLAPQLVVVRLQLDDPEGFQVLSMLKLDRETRGIPVVTCTTGDDSREELDEPLDPHDDVFRNTPALGMN